MPVPTLAPGASTTITADKIFGTSACSDPTMLWEIWDFNTNESFISDMVPGSGYSVAPNGAGGQIWTLPGNAPQGLATGDGRFEFRVSPAWKLANM